MAATLSLKVKRTKMKGVKYLVDAEGKPKTVLLDLKVHGALWEDICDILVIRKRRKQPRIPFEQVDTELRKLGKIK